MKFIMALAKNLMLPFGLIAAAEICRYAGIQKSTHWSASRTIKLQGITLIISNEEMKDMKIVRSIEGSSISIIGITKTIENETKNRYILICY